MFRELVIAKRRQHDEFDRDVTLAWQIEAMARQKKMPELKKLLAKRAEKPQSVHEMKTVLQTLSAQIGIPLRKAASPARGAA